MSAESDQQAVPALPRVTSVVTTNPPGAAAQVGVQFEEVDSVEIVAIYQSLRAGPLNYVCLAKIGHNGRSDIFWLSVRDPEHPKLGPCAMEQQRAALFLRGAIAYAQVEENECTPMERLLIEAVASSIRLLDAGTHP